MRRCKLATLQALQACGMLQFAVLQLTWLELVAALQLVAALLLDWWVMLLYSDGGPNRWRAMLLKLLFFFKSVTSTASSTREKEREKDNDKLFYVRERKIMKERALKPVWSHSSQMLVLFQS
jgi:hypothetical protein